VRAEAHLHKYIKAFGLRPSANQRLRQRFSTTQPNTGTEGVSIYVNWDDPSGLTNPAFLSELRNGMLDELVHRIFYPNMRKMGLHPEENDKIWITKYMAGKVLPPSAGVDQARLYFKFTLNLNDAKLSARFDKWFEENKWSEGLQKGRQLVRIVKESDPQTPDRIIAVFLQCAQIVSPPAVKYSFVSWQPVVNGRELPHAAVIAVRLAFGTPLPN
jgi:hypothetical protein